MRAGEKGREPSGGSFRTSDEGKAETKLSAEGGGAVGGVLSEGGMQVDANGDV